MKAIRFLGNERVVVEKVNDPVPNDDEVVVQIKASALCRSDLSIYHGTPVLNKKIEGSVIPGHEPCGVVYQLGKNVDPNFLKIGDRVAIYLAIGCGHCSYCSMGYQMLCPDWKCIGFDRDGGHAEYIKIPAINCLKLPDNMDYIDGALSTDKFGTLYHAQTRIGVSSKDYVAVFGIGPMGGAGIMIAKALGAQVIAVDVLDNRLELAQDIGADFVINSAQVDFLEAVRDITHGNMVNVAIDCSGNTKAENNALLCVKPFGTTIFIGENKECTINPSDQLIRKEANLIGSWYFPIWQYDEINRFIVNKKIPLKKIVTHTFVIDQAKEAYEMFDRRETGAVVITND